MLKAGSLIYTVFIVFLTGILASSFLLYHQLSQKETDIYLLHFRLEKNARSGIQYLLAAGEYMEYDQPKKLQLSEHPADSIEVYRKSWGIFDIGISKSHYKKISKQSVCLIGSRWIGEEKTGLYVADLDRAILLCGKTVLDGITYLPTQGVKRAYIEGQNYLGDKLVYGTQRKSKREIPLPDEKFIRQNYDRIQGKTHYTDSVIDFDILQSDTLFHPFHQKTLVIRKEGKLILSSGIYSGNIIFMASREIELKGNCKIENVLLFAPEINIASSDTCFFQAFATDSIRVKEKSVLLYPSVLGIIKDEKHRESEPQLLLENDVTFAGSLFACDLNPDYKHYPCVITGERCKIYGEVYSQGNASLQGEIYGSAIVFKLRLQTKTSSYENHLLSSVINGNKVPPSFCGMPLKEKRYGKILLYYL